MCKIQRVRWTVIAQTPPQPWIVCQGCRASSAYRSSGKFRLNANGRRLDAWLVYNCIGCGKSWNCPLFERRAVRAIEPAMLDALHRNDPDLVRRAAFDLDALRRSATRIDVFADHVLEKTVLEDCPAPTRLAIALQVPVPVGLRLDRLLSQELDLSRTRLHQLHATGILAIRPDGGHPLRRSVAGGTEIAVDLSGLPGEFNCRAERAMVNSPCAGC